mmetsp:Transcript_19688/g.49975  ORF Transcript_19688/g.49975 Transcript_19688/m.49975 type:complete len:294 (-) Transcript_19688:857-1738(-)
MTAFWGLSSRNSMFCSLHSAMEDDMQWRTRRLVSSCSLYQDMMASTHSGRFSRSTCDMRDTAAVGLDINCMISSRSIWDVSRSSGSSSSVGGRSDSDNFMGEFWPSNSDLTAWDILPDIFVLGFLASRIMRWCTRFDNTTTNTYSWSLNRRSAIEESGRDVSVLAIAEMTSLPMASSMYRTINENVFFSPISPLTADSKSFKKNTRGRRMMRYTGLCPILWHSSSLMVVMPDRKRPCADSQISLLGGSNAFTLRVVDTPVSRPVSFGLHRVFSPRASTFEDWVRLSERDTPWE